MGRFVEEKQACVRNKTHENVHVCTYRKLLCFFLARRKSHDSSGC